MDYGKYLEGVRGMDTFTKQDLRQSFIDAGYAFGNTAFTVELQKMVSDGIIQRLQRNVYSLDTGKTIYRHKYSHEAIDLAALLENRFNGMKFTVFELEQLNRFVNHLIAQNIIFLFVERDLVPYVFDYIYHLGTYHVLLNPTAKEYRFYFERNEIIVLPQVSQYPVDRNVCWQECLEKYLVDVVAERAIRRTFSPGEYPLVFEQAFRFYQLNKASLMRYAKRRHADDKMRRIAQAANEEWGSHIEL